MLAVYLLIWNNKRNAPHHNPTMSKMVKLILIAEVPELREADLSIPVLVNNCNHLINLLHTISELGRKFD